MTMPVERLQRPQFMSPPIADGRSLSNAFVGRLSIASGSATGTVSTTNAKSDMVLGHAIEANIAAEFITAGLMSIVSGAGYGTASTTAITSGAIVEALPRMADVASGFGSAVKANSIVDGVSFAIGTQDGIGPGATANVMWRIHGKDPGPVKVTTVVDGAFFTLGWADGLARPYNATVHWQILKTN